MSEHSPIVEQAILALKEQRPAEAAEILKDHIWRDPADGIAYAFLGVALSELGDTPSALEALERAHYLNPQDAGILYNYGVVLEAAGRTKEARIRFNAALRIDPEYRRALQRLAALDGGAAPSLQPGEARSAPQQPAPPPRPVEPSPTSRPPASQPVSAPAACPPVAPTNGHAAVTERLPAEDAARPAAPTGRKWVRDRSRSSEAPTEGEEPQHPSPTHATAAPPTASVPTPEAAHAAVDPQPPPGSFAPRERPQQPWSIFPTPSAGSWIDQGAVLLKNRWVVVGLCALFSTGGLIAGIAIRGASTPAVPAPTDPLSASGLKRGNLAGAQLAGLSLSGVDLAGENLQRVRAEKVDLSNAFLARADLREARLERSDLTGADLSHANLPRANLLGARGRGAKFTGAFLRGAYLKASVFPEADFQEAYLSGTNLGHSDLSGSNLSGADLRGAQLVNTVLNSAILNGCQLQGANLSRARLEGTQLKGARFDARTVWPAGFNPKSRGAIPAKPATAALPTPAAARVQPAAARPAAQPASEPHTRP